MKYFATSVPRFVAANPKLGEAIGGAFGVLLILALRAWLA